MYSWWLIHLECSFEIKLSTSERLGIDQLRKVRFDDGLLVLMPPPVTIDGSQVQREIYWERISVAAA